MKQKQRNKLKRVNEVRVDTRNVMTEVLMYCKLSERKGLIP
jgi:hypothetical protein